MTPEVLVTSIVIFFARILDVSLGTLRTMTVVRGRRRVAFVLGFFEVVVWIFAVARVIDNLQNPVVAIAYSLGFATGSVVGMTLERHLSMGQRVIRVLSERGQEIAARVRAAGFKVAQVVGQSGGQAAISLLYIEVQHRKTNEILGIIHELDPHCFYVVEDVRASPTPLATSVPRTGWLSTVMRK